MKRQLKIIALFALLIFNKSNAQSNSKTEKLTINWPKEEDWHVVDQQNNAEQTTTMIILLKGKETIVNRSEIATTYICRGSMNVSLEKKMEEFFKPLKYAPTAKREIIEKNENTKYPWFIYKIECPTESQLWYVIKGKTELYCTLWSTNQKEITSKNQEKWVKIFKSSKILSE